MIENILLSALSWGAGHPITIGVEGDTKAGQLFVRDRGRGIAPRDHDRIFDAFTRLESIRNFGGFGLGLWPAREIVREHGGSISVTSEPKQGALFTVVLPRNVGAHTALRAPRADER